MGSYNTNKSIAQELSRDFEILAFAAVKSSLGKVNFIEEELTDAVNDGGYDGKFIYCLNGSIVTTLFEAKLRSDITADLPLNDFAKSLIIAVTRHADNVYIVTNLHFSKGTIDKISAFSEKSELDIQLYNGYSINMFITDNKHIVNGVSEKLLDFLQTSDLSYGSQFLPNKSQYQVNQPAIDKKLLEEFKLKLTSFSKKEQKLLVLGSPHMGKTYYIEQMVYYFRSNNINIQTIDVSKCSTYKQFFLELLEKVLGLSFELVDLLDDEAFNDAFKEIGIYTVDANDLKTLRFIFSKQDNIEYDYSVVFSKICKLFNKLLIGRKRKKQFIIAFLNLSFSEKEVLQLLLYLLKNSNFSSILEVTENEYRYNGGEDWNKIKEQFHVLENLMEAFVRIPDWEFKQQKNFLQDQLPNITEKQCRELIKKFGKTPRDLTRLIELIHNSNLYEHTPVEMIFQDIMYNNADTEDYLDIKCLEYLQLKNSYILYIYAFLILFNGEVKKTFLEEFKKDIDWIDECYIILKKSNLFSLTMGSISVANSKTFESLKYYYDSIASFNIMEDAVKYVKENISELQLSKGELLELRVNLACYTDIHEYIYLLIELGDSYLNCDQIRKAHETFKLASSVILENDLKLDEIQELQIQIGLIKTSIWNIEKNKQEIKESIAITENIINKVTKEDTFFLRLKLKFYLLCYQFNHSQGNAEEALENAKAGIDLVEKYDLYQCDMPSCGTIWRFYAIAVKEVTQSIEQCLSIFETAKEKCKGDAKFMYGYIIHKNMNIREPNFKKRLQEKLDNYGSLTYVEEYLSIDEYLHYQVNVAALYFNLKRYDEAWTIYIKILQKSLIFEITREQIRILNDMSNIEWIRGNIEAASIKYAKAIEIAKDAGYYHNYWPVLLNFISLRVYQHDYENALDLHYELMPHFEIVCENFTKKQLAPETSEYYRAAIIIYLRNLWSISQKLETISVSKYIQKICNISQICKCEDISDIDKKTTNLTLQDTMYEHSMHDKNKIYLLKN